MESPYLITVDEQRCRACGACARRCPQGNFALEDGTSAVAVKSGFTCVGCLACVKWCPTRALSVRPAQTVTAYLRAR